MASGEQGALGYEQPWTYRRDDGAPRRPRPEEVDDVLAARHEEARRSGGGEGVERIPEGSGASWCTLVTPRYHQGQTLLLRIPRCVRNAAGAREAADVDESLDAGLTERLDQLLERVHSIVESEGLMHTIAARMVGSGRDG